MSYEEISNIFESDSEIGLITEVFGLVNHSIRKATKRFFGPTINQSSSLSDLPLDNLEALPISLKDSTKSLPIPTTIKDDSTLMATSCSPMSLDSMSELSESPLEESIMNQRNPDNLPIISLQEVQDHDSPRDAWMVVYDVVYNFTTFIEEHPGGFDVMMDYIGYDGTWAFRGTGHSKQALEMMKSYRIGILPESQRLYENKLHW